MRESKGHLHELLAQLPNKEGSSFEVGYLPPESTKDGDHSSASEDVFQSLLRTLQGYRFQAERVFRICIMFLQLGTVKIVVRILLEKRRTRRPAQRVCRPSFVKWRKRWRRKCLLVVGEVKKAPEREG